MSKTVITASEFQKHFGQYHDRALREPVAIKKHNRISVVMVSAEEYDRLKQADRRAFRAEEMPEDLVRAVGDAEIPAEHRYDNSDA